MVVSLRSHCNHMPSNILYWYRLHLCPLQYCIVPGYRLKCPRTHRLLSFSMALLFHYTLKVYHVDVCVRMFMGVWVSKLLPSLLEGEALASVDLIEKVLIVEQQPVTAIMRQ